VSRCFYAESKALAKIVAPASDRLICHRYTALKEQFLDGAKTRLETETPSDSAADDTNWDAVNLKKRFGSFHPAILRDRPNTLAGPLQVFQDFCRSPYTRTAVARIQTSSDVARERR
jgi:hypothetical protein